MIHCCVKNCDTDENVVNCTSVFFVGFPSDADLRAHWIEVLSSSLRDGFGGADSGKICSCHFAEDAFGRHPVHGYRFLLPGAIPTVFPVAPEELLPAVEEEEEAADLGQFVDDIVEEEELITYGEAEEEEEPPVEEQAPQQVVEFDPEEELLGEEPSSGQPLTIGIEYANGRYYFLQSENESEEELIERDSQISVLLPEDPRVMVLEEPEGGPDKEAAFNFEVFQKSEVEFPLKNEQPEADVSAEMDSLITTSEFVEQEGSLISSTGNQAQITVKQEPQNFILAKHEDDPQSIELTESRMLEVEETEEKGNVKAKEKKVFKHFCQQCSKGFQYESGLKKHLLVHNGMKPHSCETCGKSFSQKINLTIHLRRHTGEEPLKKYTCPVCEKKCIRMSELKLHIKSHWRKFPHACPLCTERFSDVTNFYDHIKSVHREELTLQEAIDMIAQNENAEVIVPGAVTLVEDDALPDSVMLDEGFYTCTVCVKTFKTERLLRKHKRKLHPKVFVCVHCSKQFLYKSLLEKHLRVHTQEKPFLCEFCQTPFSQKINLEVHLVKKHNISVAGKVVAQKNLPCPYCSKKFDRPSSLNNHLRTHTRERPFACKVCPKTFVSNSALSAHVRTHHQGESILLHPAKRLSMAASSLTGSNYSIVNGGNGATGGFVTVPESAENGDQQDLITVVSNAGRDGDENDDVNVIRYSIQFITPSEQGDVRG